MSAPGHGDVEVGPSRTEKRWFVATELMRRLKTLFRQDLPLVCLDRPSAPQRILKSVPGSIPGPQAPSAAAQIGP